MELRILLDKYYYKEEIQDLCSQAGLSPTGKKDVLIDRLINDSSYTIKDYIMSLDRDTLNDLCDDLDVSAFGRKKTLADRCVPKIRKSKSKAKKKEKPKVEKAPPPSPQPQAPPPQYQAPPPQYPQQAQPQPQVMHVPVPQSQVPSKGIDHLLQAINSWTPKRRYPHEDGYQSDLSHFLEYQFNYQTSMEDGPTHADILINNQFPIEMKKNPTQQTYYKLMGQMIAHRGAHGCSIAIVCDVKRQQAFDEFRAHLEATFGDGSMIVVKK
jgi:hypothetical protein